MKSFFTLLMIVSVLSAVSQSPGYTQRTSEPPAQLEYQTEQAVKPTAKSCAQSFLLLSDPLL